MILPQFKRDDAPAPDPSRTIEATWQSGGRVVWLSWRSGEDVPTVGYKNDNILVFPPGMVEAIHKGGRRVKMEWPAEAFSPLVWYSDFRVQEADAKSLKYNWPHTQGTGKVDDEWRIGSGDDWAQQR